MAAQEQRGAVFAELHRSEPFLIPNPWDAGSARVLEDLGFRALATTSSGFAFTLGRADGGATLDELAEHVRTLTGAVRLPLSVDLEDGHGDPAAAIERVAEAGAVGGSIEDWDRAAGRIYPLDEAAERVGAAVASARALGFPFTLTGRAENQIRGNPDLDDTIARLQAYERSGADVLYAPGLRSGEEVRAVCSALSRPVNVLAHPRLSMTKVVEAGAQRVSVGGALTWIAAEALTTAARRLEGGDFSVLAASPPRTTR